MRKSTNNAHKCICLNSSRLCTYAWGISNFKLPLYKHVKNMIGQSIVNWNCPYHKKYNLYLCGHKNSNLYKYALNHAWINLRVKKSIYSILTMFFLISAKSWKLLKMETSLLTIQKIELLRRLFNFWSTWPSLAMLKQGVIPCSMEKKSISLKTELYFILLLEIGPISPLSSTVSRQFQDLNF